MPTDTTTAFERLVTHDFDQASLEDVKAVALGLWYQDFIPDFTQLPVTNLQSQLRAGYLVDRLLRYNCVSDERRKTLFANVTALKTHGETYQGEPWRTGIFCNTEYGQVLLECAYRDKQQSTQGQLSFHLRGNQLAPLVYALRKLVSEISPHRRYQEYLQQGQTNRTALPEFKAAEEKFSSRLDPIEPTKTLKLFISYSRADRDHKLTLEKHLRLIKEALKHQVKKEKIPVAPVIIRHTHWQARLGHLTVPTTENANPLEDWPSADKFWGSVQSGIHAKIEKLLKT